MYNLDIATSVSTNDDNSYFYVKVEVTDTLDLNLVVNAEGEDLLTVLEDVFTDLGDQYTEEIKRQTQAKMSEINNMSETNTVSTYDDLLQKYNDLLQKYNDLVENSTDKATHREDKTNTQIIINADMFDFLNDFFGKF